jgi:hypothetical protein
MVGRVVGVDLNVNVGLDLYSRFLPVLDDRAIDGAAQVSVLVRSDTSLVSYAIVDIPVTS